MQSTPGVNAILVVEDDPIVREFIALIIPIKFPGIPICLAGNGRAGVELFKERLPGIVITDINMPEMDGIRMAGEIKTIKADTKIVVITAYDEDAFVDAFAGIGINAFIVKPIELDKLFAAIEGCLAEIAAERGAGDRPPGR